MSSFDLTNYLFSYFSMTVNQHNLDSSILDETIPSLVG